MRYEVLLPVACLLMLGAATSAMAGPAEDCATNDGTYLTGTVTSAPKFVPGHKRRGVELSHSRLNLKTDDGKTYQVAMDNVFAEGYDSANPHRQVPAPLNTIKVGDKLGVCGITYTNPLGIHFVHTICDQTPAPAAPNGWVEELQADGTPGANLEGFGKYCHLWP